MCVAARIVVLRRATLWWVSFVLVRIENQFGRGVEFVSKSTERLICLEG